MNDVIWRPEVAPVVYSALSLERLSTCHPSLQQIFHSLAIDGYNIAIVCGHRNETAQTVAYDNGRSHAQWPNSKHNKMLSEAIDAGPWIQDLGIPWHSGDNIWVQFAGVVLAKAAYLGIDLRWGGFFDGLKDLNHFELII